MVAKFVMPILLIAFVAGGCTSDGSTADKRFSQECGSGLQLCADEGLIRAHILVKSCANGQCRTQSLSRAPYLEFVQLDGPPEERCGPGDCGAAADALQQGWNPGRWRITAPPLEGLQPPEPITIDLDASEVLDLNFVYREKKRT